MTGEISELRVPHRRVLVEASSGGKGKRRVELSLAEAGRDPDWRDVGALLESDRDFVPFRVPDSDDWAMLNKSQLVSIVVIEDSGGDDNPGIEVLYDQRRHVAIDLNNGERIEGELLWAAPAERSRVVDHINGTEKFLRLFRNEQVCFVRKAAVIELAEMTESGR